MKLTAIIVEDEETSREILKNYLKKYCPNVAIEALNAHASYYLMKPISIDELIKAVDYVTEIRTKEDALQDEILVPKTNSVAGKISIPQLDGFEVLNTSDILYCKADDNYTEIYLNTNKKKKKEKGVAWC